MAKKSVVSYAGLALGPPQATAHEGPSPEPQGLPARRSAPAGGHTLKDVSAHLMLYLHPDAAKALKRYALDQDVKVHDLLIDAIESWFRAHGLQGPVRAETGRRKP